MKRRVSRRIDRESEGHQSDTQLFRGSVTRPAPPAAGHVLAKTLIARQPVATGKSIGDSSDRSRCHPGQCAHDRVHVRSAHVILIAGSTPHRSRWDLSLDKGRS